MGLTIREISTRELREATLSDLGFDKSDERDFFHDEVLAQILRRSLALRAPMSPRALFEEVAASLVHLHGFGVSRQRVLEIIDALVSFGDFVETWDIDDGGSRRRRVLYPSAYSFVELPDGGALLLGVPTDNQGALRSTLRTGLNWRGITRRLRPLPGLADDLLTEGLNKVSLSDWLLAPPPAPLARIVGFMKSKLDTVGPSGRVDGLRIIRRTDNDGYYIGRWGPPTDETGLYIGRRPRAYGSELWCLVKLESGLARAAVDLPIQEEGRPTHDEAWYFQAAISAIDGSPHELQVEVDTETESALLSINFPLPSWAHRRLEMVGEMVGRRPKALFTFELDVSAIDTEVGFLKESLWMEVMDD